MKKNHVWKQLLIGCLVAVQCLTLAPLAMAQGDSNASQSTTINGPVGPVTEETPEIPDGNDPVSPPVTDQVPDESDSDNGPAEGSDEVFDGTDIGDAGSEETPFAYGIDTTQYGSDVLVILANSNVMIHNNVEYRAPQPITVKNGVSYVSLRTLTERFGYVLTFDNKTKESIINNGGQELRYKMNTDTYKVAGVPTKMSGKSYIDKGTFMVPLTSALQAYKMPYQWDNVNKRIIVQMTAVPVAKFSVVQSEIFAGQTEVTVNDESFHPRGKQIIDTEWTGLESYYSEPGRKTISLRVMDVDGVWSEPYSVTINVLPPNAPPVADFMTEKTTYKMGEFIVYDDLSTDDEDAITERVWSNKEHAFFKPGDYYITLRVTDKHGASNEVAKKITVTNETLYTFDEFNQLYSEIGEVYTFNGSSILNMETITPVTKHLTRTLYRTNSPESIKSDGIVYQDKIAGATRVLLHHKNATTRNMKLYVIATNISEEDAVVRVEHTGIAGPNPFPQQTGKFAAERYFDSFGKNGRISEEVLKPKQSTILVKDLSKTALKPEQIYTMYADFNSDNNLQYQIVALDANKDIWKELPKLAKLDPDGVHIRGTFNNSDRKMTVSNLVGEKAGRLLIADNKLDTFLHGYDTMNGESRVNAGNYGVLYHIELERVAPNTLISFNARGGSYAGALLVNGKTVGTPNRGTLSTSNQASAVYRTGNSEEKVDIWFTPAAGSSLPVNLLFTPMPDNRTP